jgi:hypothetical protein
MQVYIMLLQEATLTVLIVIMMFHMTIYMSLATNLMELFR